MNAMKLLPLLLLAIPACTTPEKQAPTNAPPSTEKVASNAAATTEATGAPATTPIPVSDEATPPLYVKVRAPATLSTDSDVELDVEIIRSSPDATPMILAITVPTGAQLVKGLAKETIVDTTSTSVHRFVTVHVGSTLPISDVAVTVDANGAGSGVHATGAYRFGRPEPKLAQPTPGNGSSLSAKGVKLGKPIKAD